MRGAKSAADERPESITATPTPVAAGFISGSPSTSRKVSLPRLDPVGGRTTLPSTGCSGASVDSPRTFGDEARLSNLLAGTSASTALTFGSVCFTLPWTALTAWATLSSPCPFALVTMTWTRPQGWFACRRNAASSLPEGEPGSEGWFERVAEPCGACAQAGDEQTANRTHASTIRTTWR